MSSKPHPLSTPHDVPPSDEGYPPALRSLLDEMPDVFYEVRVGNDPFSGRVVYVNRRAMELTGISPEQFRADPSLWFGAVHEDDRDALNASTADVLTHRRTGRRSYRLRNAKTQEYVWIEDIASPILDGSGTVTGIRGFGREITKQKEVEQRISEHERQFRALFENSPVGIGVARRDGTLITFNQALLRLGGYTREEILDIGNVAALYYDSEERAKILARFAAEGMVRDVPVRFRRKDGSSFDTLLSLIPTVFEGEECVQAIVLDVTEQKQAQERLLRLEKAVDSSEEIIFMTDPDGIITYVNPSFTRYYGYTPVDVVGRETPRILKSGRVSEEAYETFWSTIVAQGVYHGEIINKAKDGSFIHVEVSVNPVVDDEGSTVGYLAIQRSIDERKAAEAALRISEEKYRSLFEESKDAILITTPEGRINDINQAGLDLFGYESVEEIRKVDISRDLYVDPSRRSAFQALMQRQGFVENHESSVRRRDGSLLTVVETTTSVRDINGKITGYRAILRDITHQKELEDQLRQAQKMESLGTLAGGIAHDFNNILGIILAHSTHIPSIRGNDEKVAQSLQAIQKASQRGAGLVKQLLTFARKSETRYALVDINEIIKEISRLTKETFPRTIVLDLQLDTDLPALYGDPSQLHQVILNLCVNARDAMPDGGTLSLHTTFTPPGTFAPRPGMPAPGSVHVRVADTGAGMDPSVRDRIFEPFFTTKEPGKGTGLGLALVYGIVKSHNGLLTVDTERGKGTRFDLYFPVHEEHNRSKPSNEADQGASVDGQETVLIVEDETMLRDLLESILSDSGYTVLTANDGQQAVEVFRSHHADIDVVMTDLGLPKLGGEDVVRSIRSIDGKARVIVASGFIEPDVRRRLDKLGLNGIVEKPYRARDVLQSIREALD